MAPVFVVAPIVLTATSAVAAAMGFAVVSKTLADVEKIFGGVEHNEAVVQFDVAEAKGLLKLLNDRGPIVLDRDDATLCFRPGKGRVQLQVKSKGQATKEELEKLGRSVLDAVTQQYAYHTVVSDLKARGFDKVDESRDEDGTIRLRLRRWD